MNTDLILPMIFNLLLVIPLYLASKEDMKYHRIDKKYVVAILLIVLVFNLISTEFVIERTFSLLITLGIFGTITFVSKGGFGFGDTLILAALGWYIGSLLYLRQFYLILVVVMVIWGAYQIWLFRKKDKRKIKDFFKMKEILPIAEVTTGMILANDYFMKGLNEEDIKKLKKEGKVYLEVKQAYPFIPVILISFMIYIFFSVF